MRSFEEYFMNSRVNDIDKFKSELRSLEIEEKKVDATLKEIFDKKRRRHRIFRAGTIIEMAGLLYDYDDERLLKVLIENRYSIIK